MDRSEADLAYVHLYDLDQLERLEGLSVDLNGLRSCVVVLCLLLIVWKHTNEVYVSLRWIEEGEVIFCLTSIS